VLLTLSWTSYSARADTPTRARVEAGKRAPFSGVLLTDAALARIITDYEQQIKTLTLDLEKARREAKAQETLSKVVCAAKVEGEQAKQAACTRDLTRQKSLYEKALKQCSKDPPWYKSPFLSFMIGNVVAGGVCVAATRIK
jgi:hypothetical protein